MSGVLRNKADRLPVTLFVLYFFVDAAAFLIIDRWYVAAIWMLIGIFPKACICSFGHHHQHLATFKGVFLNRVLEVIYAFQTGITSHAWWLHHVIGHHRHYLDQDLDESAWMRKDGSCMGVIEYAFVIAATGYPRAWKAGKNFPKQRGIFLRMLILQWVIIAGLAWYNWVNTLWLVVIPMAISLFITAWHTWYHHAGLETTDDFHACNNIYHRWYNLLTGNLGYHTAHHRRGAVHWSDLPEFHRDKIHDKVPDERVHGPCIPFKWMPAEPFLHLEAAGDTGA